VERREAGASDAAFKQFMRTDQQVIAAYRRGTAADVRGRLYRVRAGGRVYVASRSEASGLRAGAVFRCTVRAPLPLLGGAPELSACRPAG
jgi:hypothetical protein